MVFLIVLVVGIKDDNHTTIMFLFQAIQEFQSVYVVIFVCVQCLEVGGSFHDRVKHGYRKNVTLPQFCFFFKPNMDIHKSVPG